MALNGNNTENVVKVKDKKFKASDFKKQWVLLAFSAIFLLYGLVFYYLPIAGWVIAFKDFQWKSTDVFKSFALSDWCGLDKFNFLFFGDFDFEIVKENFAATVELVKAGNYTWKQFMLVAPVNWDFLRVLWNTLGMGVINLVVTFVTAILFAILLNEVRLKNTKKVIQTISYLPHFLSWVIVAGIVHDSFSNTGIINDILGWLHITNRVDGTLWDNILNAIKIPNGPITFFLKDKWFWPIIAMANVWKETGWNAIIYLAAITSIDPSLYEAAEVDGAGRIQKMLHITLPGIKPTIMILLVMNIGNILNAGFEAQYLLKNDSILRTARTLDIYVLDWGISQNDYGLGTAAGIFKSVVCIVMILIANGVAKKSGEEHLF